MSKVLTAAEILKADDRKIETVPVPEWNGSVMIREMSGAEKDKFDVSLRDSDDKLNFDNYRAKIVASCACDENGVLIFTPSQVTALGLKSSVVLTRLVKVAERLNGMNKEAVAAAKKDSEPEASDASPSA